LEWKYPIREYPFFRGFTARASSTSRDSRVRSCCEVTQKLSAPNPKTLIGQGKLAEVKALVEENQADLLIFDEELSPRHQRELKTYFWKRFAS
jgi:50S ribosomal subunit-associated GTPase HflX